MKSQYLVSVVLSPGHRARMPNLPAGIGPPSTGNGRAEVDLRYNVFRSAEAVHCQRERLMACTRALPGNVGVQGPRVKRAVVARR